MPKIKTDKINGGTRQAETVYIILPTDSLLFKCGDTETFHRCAGAVV